MLSNSTKLIPAKNCTWKELGGNVVILQSEQRPPVTHELNSTSTFIWNYLQLNDLAKFDDVLTALVEEFDVDSQLAKKDLENLIINLIDKKLLCTMD